MAQVDTSKHYVGRRAKIGNICQTDDRLGVFGGYTPCCKSKLVYSFDEARMLAYKFSGNKRKTFKKVLADILIPVLED